MLASLGFSAVAGVLAVLMAGQDVVWRIVGTGMLAAVASGLMIVLSLLMDKEKSRAAGLLGMCAVVLAFLLSLFLVWDLRFASRGEEPAVFALLLVLGATPPLMLFLRVMFASGGKWAGIVGVVGCAAGCALIIIAILWVDSTGRYSGVEDSLMASAWAVSGFAALAAGSLAGVGVHRRWWRWVGVVASGAACAMALIGIWMHLDNGDVLFAIVTGIAVILAHANLAFLINLRPSQEWLRWGTVGAVILTSLLLDVVAFEGPGGGGFDDFFSRGAGAAAIAAGCGTLALLVLARLNRKISTQSIPPGVKELALICPWCQRKQTVPLGSSSCAGCGLKFQIAIEEPHCPNCDYLLYMLASDRYPECGTAIQSTASVSQVGIT
jgi:hypothetical protein